MLIKDAKVEKSEYTYGHWEIQRNFVNRQRVALYTDNGFVIPIALDSFFHDLKQLKKDMIEIDEQYKEYWEGLNG